MYCTLPFFLEFGPVDGCLGNRRKAVRDDLTSTSEDDSQLGLPPVTYVDSDTDQEGEQSEMKEKAARDRTAGKEAKIGSSATVHRVRPGPKSAMTNVTPSEMREALKKRMVAKKSYKVS